MTALAELFPAEDYRFHLTLRRAGLDTFFAATSARAGIAAERRRWLDVAPARYAAIQPAGEPLLAEFAALARTWFPEAGPSLRELGIALEPDFLLLAPDADGFFRLHGGVLCFPTSWALEEKLGRTLDEIHGVVPGLNAALGGPLQQFLAKLRPGPAYLRANWGLAATPELNLHPALGRPRLAAPLDPDRIWLRIEHQALAALPTSGGVVFGIRIEVHPLRTVLADASVRAGLHRALATMPDAMVAYKGLAAVRAELLTLAAG